MSELITKSFTIVKKNRVWIEAKIGNYKAKIKLNEQASDLKEGNNYDLIVKDISVRSKYGTDLRFEICEQVDEWVFIKHFRYNSLLTKSLKSLGGKWDPESDSWAIPAFSRDQVDNLEILYNGPMSAIEIEAKEYISCLHAPIEFAGYTIASATGRDSGARLDSHVSMIKGSVSSGGSIANWRTTMSEGTILRFKIPKALLEKHLESEAEFFNIKEL